MVLTGVLNIIFSSGSASGGPLGGFLTDKLNWRWYEFNSTFNDFSTHLVHRAFLLQVPFTILSITIVSFTLHLPSKEPTNLRSKFARIDFLGSLLLVLGTFALLLAFGWWQNYLEKNLHLNPPHPRSNSIGDTEQHLPPTTNSTSTTTMAMAVIDQHLRPFVRPPLMKLSLWRRANGRFAAVQLIAFLEWASYISWGFWALVSVDS